MSNTSKHLHCDKCAELTESGFAEMKLTRCGKTFTFENVEMEICPNCGEKYIHDSVLRKYSALIKEEPVTV